MNCRAPAHHPQSHSRRRHPIGAALLTYGLMRGSEEVKRVSLLVFVVLAIITVPTYLAGQAAEDVVEHLPGVDDDFIHTHEDAATIGPVVTSILGAISVVGLGLSFSPRAPSSPEQSRNPADVVRRRGMLGRVANLGGKFDIPSYVTAPGLTMTTIMTKADDDDGDRRRDRNRRGRDR
jgi:hypothetical protein